MTRSTIWRAVDVEGDMAAVVVEMAAVVAGPDAAEAAPVETTSAPINIFMLWPTPPAVVSIRQTHKIFRQRLPTWQRNCAVSTASDTIRRIKRKPVSDARSV